MDPYNLAVCFGPTLLPMPAGQDPVALQGRVNQLVQTLILQPARVFPPLTQLPGPVYEKCMAPPSASCLGYALRAACMGGRGVQWRGAPSTAHVPLSALDLRDTQPEGLAGENELELEAGTPTQEDGEGVGKEDHTLSRSWGFSPPPPLRPPLLLSPRGRRGGCGLLCLHGPHGPGADLPERGRAAAARAGLRRLVAGRVRGHRRPGPHSSQVHHTARGVSERPMLPGGSPQLLLHSGPSPAPTRVPASVGILCAFLTASGWH